MKSFLSNKIKRLIRHDSVPFGAILMLHRIESLNNNALWANEHLKLSPSTLEEMIIYAKLLGCSFISMDELYNIIKKKKWVRKVIVVTLDDGYKDNYTNGIPCFVQENVPFCLNICTDVINKKYDYWWYAVEEIILNNESVILDNGTVLNCSSLEDKEDAFKRVKEMISNVPQESLRNCVSLLFKNYKLNWTKYSDLGMTWEELREISNFPLATIANHTVSHPIFKMLNDNDIRNEISNAQNELASRLKSIPNHFCIPYGATQAVSEDNHEYLRMFQFDTITTTFSGMVKYGTDPLRLPRFSVTEKNWKDIIDNIVATC